MKIKTKGTTEQALATVREFLEALVANGKRLGWHDDEILMTGRDGMVLTFTSAERARFYRCLVTMGRAGYSRPIAEDTLRQSLEEALFGCLTDSPDDVSTRIATGVDVVRCALRAPERAWRVAFRIQWLEGKELPFRYRNVNFAAAGREAVLSALESNLGATKVDDAVFQFLPETTDGLAVAVVDVNACDLTSARALGLETVHSAVDELTGLTSLVSNPSSHVLTDVMNALPIALVTLAIDTSTDELAVDLPIPLPWDGVRPRTLLELLGRSASPRTLQAIFGTGTDEVTERIRSTARHIGRAQQCRFQHRTADAFLYYVIAIEALLGKSDFRDSIGYQLRMRVAHLIGKDAEERGEIEHDIVRLYDVRSKLAHSGIREVRALDLTQARGYAVRCLANALFIDPWKGFERFRDFEECFRQRLLT